jgi:hypothetical protein
VAEVETWFIGPGNFLADGIGSYVRGVSSSASMGGKIREISPSNRTMKTAVYVSKTKQL